MGYSEVFRSSNLEVKKQQLCEELRTRFEELTKLDSDLAKELLSVFARSYGLYLRRDDSVAYIDHVFDTLAEFYVRNNNKTATWDEIWALFPTTMKSRVQRVIYRTRRNWFSIGRVGAARVVSGVHINSLLFPELEEKYKKKLGNI